MPAIARYPGCLIRSLLYFNRNFVCEFSKCGENALSGHRELINESAAGAIFSYGFVDERAKFAAR
jgi:hypothetical protein